MGKRGKGWFCPLRKVFTRRSKNKKGEKSKKNDPENKVSDPSFYEISESIVSDAAPPPPPPPPPVQSMPPLPVDELEQSKHVDSVAIDSAAAVSAASVDAHVSRLAAATRFASNSNEELAAIKIQTAFRGYLARRALRGLRGLVRLKLLIHGNSVKRQAATTLRCMQTLARVQSQIRSRRIRMLEENQALQRQLLLKRERDIENLRMSEEWDDSIQSKEQIEAGLLSKQEATMRRERALAYAFSHQWRNSSKLVNPTFMDPKNPQWGWSWLERWMAARPWESRSAATDKEPNGDQSSVKSSNGGEILKSYARRDAVVDGTAATMPEKSVRPPSRQSLATPRTKLPSSIGKTKSASPKSGRTPHDDDTRSILSVQSERPRRHSMAGSSIGDDESLASSPAIPSYMAPTQSAKLKNRNQSPLSDEKIEITTDKASVGSAKKRLSFPNSPAAVRRHSGPPRIDASSLAVKAAPVGSQQNGSNMVASAES